MGDIRPMRYKVGDRVRIKTWEEMEAEYGTNTNGSIRCDIIFVFVPKMEKELNELKTDRTLTIRKINELYKYYFMKETTGYFWNDKMIECLVEDYKETEIEIFEPIISRFEILDIR